MKKKPGVMFYVILLLVLVVGVLVGAWLLYGPKGDEVTQADEVQDPIVEESAQTEISVKRSEILITLNEGSDLKVCADKDSVVSSEKAMEPLVPLAHYRGDHIAPWLYVKDNAGNTGWVLMSIVKSENPIIVDDNLPMKDGTCTEGQLLDPEVPVIESAPKEVESKVVEYEAPANHFPLLDEEGNLLGVSYSLNTTGPHIVEYPYQSTLIWASGKFTLAGDIATLFVGEFSFAFAEDIGDIIFDVCEDESGCTAGSIGMKAGHAMVTIVFPGYEDPKDSLAWAINNMFDPDSGNCGSSCNRVFVGDMADGGVREYTSEVSAISLPYAIMPDAPYAKVSLIGESVPGGAKVLTNGETPIGHLYYLADKTAYVSVNEAGGTVIYCGANCEIGDTTYDAGTAVSFVGVPTDGSTPKDLNYTIKVKSSDPAMIRVILIYSGSFESEISRLKEQYSDWVWIE